MSVTNTSLLGFRYLILEKMPNTTLVTVIMTGSEGDTWEPRAGAFHGIFQNIPYNNCLLCFHEKGSLDPGMVTGEVLKGSVALNELKIVRELVMLCATLKVRMVIPHF